MFIYVFILLLIISIYLVFDNNNEPFAIDYNSTSKKKFNTWLTYYGSGLLRNKNYEIIEKKDTTENPFEKNCYDIIDDPGILKEIDVNKNWGQYKNEISAKDMKTLLDTITKDNIGNKELLNKTSETVKGIPLTYKLVIDWFVNELNKKILDFDIKNDYHHLNFNNKNKLNLYKTTDTVDYFHFTTIINRELKNVVFIIHSKMYYNKKTSEIKVLESILTGIDTSEYAAAGFLDYNRNTLLKCDKKGQDCSLSNKKYCNAANVKLGYYNSYLINMKEREKDNLNSKCFYKKADTKVECSSVGIDGTTGIWDTKCTKDTDCPFFGAKGNLNYKNTRGGCNKDSGICELPLNMVNIGYKLYRKGKLYRPLCHNCLSIKDCIGKECSQCCEDQGVKPDYAFYNDKSKREDQKTSLEEKGLKVSDIRLR